MASRKVPSAFKRDQNVSDNSKSSNGGGEGSDANNSGSKRKTKLSGTTVKSRYMQPVDKAALSKSNSLTNELITVQPRPSSPKPGGVKPRVGSVSRRPVAPQSLTTSMLSSVLEPANLGRTILQSTVLDGLDCNRPDFDVSVIKDKTIHNATEPGRKMDNEKRMQDIHNETILLTYLTAKMESNTSKLKAEAEQQLLAMLQEEEHLSKELHEKKRQCLFLEKNKQMNDILDLQIAALTSVAEVTQSFTEDYKCFGTAIDTTRHELPVKHFHIEGDRREFLDKVEACLKEGEKMLVECTRGAQEDNSTTVECLRGIKKSAQDISVELPGAFTELLELSSLVSRHTVNVQQALEEEQLGPARTKLLYCGQD